MNCHLAITRVKFVYLIDACVLRRKLNRRFHNKRRRRGVGLDLDITNLKHCLSQSYPERIVDQRERIS